MYASEVMVQGHNTGGQCHLQAEGRFLRDFEALFICSKRSLLQVGELSFLCSAPASPYVLILCGLNDLSAMGLGVSSFGPLQLLGLFGEDMECLGGRGLAGGSESRRFIARPACCLISVFPYSPSFPTPTLPAPTPSSLS